MASAIFAPPIGREFDAFLCAFIGEDPNGKLLSVLSAFARTDVDPWKEAAHLARMSREGATARLSEFIAALPNKPNADVPARTIAGELVALLPVPAVFVPPLPDKVSRALASSESRLALTAGAALLLVAFTYFFWAAPSPPSPQPPSTSSAPASASPGQP